MIYTYLRYLWLCFRIFNSLPKAIKDISCKPKKFKISLKHYLLTHSFYSLDQFYSNSNI